MKLEYSLATIANLCVLTSAEVQIFSDASAGVGITTDGKISTFHPGIIPSEFEPFEAIECSNVFCCVLRLDVKDLHCFDKGIYSHNHKDVYEGRFGTGSKDHVPTEDTQNQGYSQIQVQPRVALNARVKSFAVGGQGNACAITEVDELYCWGYNIYYSVENTYHYTPEKMNVGTDPATNSPYKVKKVALGEDGGGCVMLDIGAMKCWGFYISGIRNIYEFDIPLYQLPFVIPKLVDDVFVGTRRTCARLSNNDAPLQCWGDADYNQGYGLIGYNHVVQPMDSVREDYRNVTFDFEVDDDFVTSLKFFGNIACVSSSEGEGKCYGVGWRDYYDPTENYIVNEDFPSIDFGDGFLVKRVLSNYNDEMPCFFSYAGEIRCFSSDSKVPKSIQQYVPRGNDDTAIYAGIGIGAGVIVFIVATIVIVKKKKANVNLPTALQVGGATENTAHKELPPLPTDD